ncbi:transcriptional regulator [Capnocytophaga canis]|uniref:helix-turn-helix domain-containing protein n=1 Tax=Capnocytophaga canis TaxID=1848903 RepID=UPI001AD26B20|nr:helix-turn-helix transcriptional regulator [Capnocytophaga canis]GIM60757.1 transcriptional regulator [Capnocytophaga canis]
MINTPDFVKRLQEVMEHYDLNASSLADILDIQRSSISHLLSERNKPSLEFIMKLIEQFPEVNFHWITQGKGNFPSKENSVTKIEEKKSIMQTNLFGDEPEQSATTKRKQSPPQNVAKVKEPESEISYQQISPISKVVENTPVTKVNNKKQLKKIIFFYDDNSFEVFEN